MKQLAKAVIAVMNEVKGIEKSLTVGNGANSYKGVPDQEVKKIIGDAMVKNGLCILPTGVEEQTQIDRWEETGQYGTKQKQSVFTKVTTKYLLLHESGESVELSGHGHGVDSQDKGAGKATTYALKYTLLYTFLVPTGKIDDSDAVHSDSVEVPKRSDFTLELAGCENANDLNAFISKHWISKMSDTQKKELWASATALGLNYDKTSKSFVK